MKLFAFGSLFKHIISKIERREGFATSFRLMPSEKKIIETRIKELFSNHTPLQSRSQNRRLKVEVGEFRKKKKWNGNFYC